MPRRHKTNSSMSEGKLNGLCFREDSTDQVSEPPNSNNVDLEDHESLYQFYCSSAPSHKTLVFQGSQRISEIDSLFYTTASVTNGPKLKAMIDSGSMACTLSEAAEANLLRCTPDLKKYSAEDIVIVGCGGHQVTPKAIYDLEVSVYECKMIIPVLVVPGQADEMILGSNAIKRLMTLLKEKDDYWKLMSMSVHNQNDEHCKFMSLLSNTERWRGESVPEKVGTVKLKKCVTLEPQSEHLVWGKLPESVITSMGSTVIVEPTQSKSRPTQILVGRVITPLWGDGWVPLKVVNPTLKPITLKRNTKIADVFPCIAVEEVPMVDIQSNVQHTENKGRPARSLEEVSHVL